VQLVSQISNLCGPDPPTLQTDRRTDGRTDRRTACDLNTALCIVVHRVVKAVILFWFWVNIISKQLKKNMKNVKADQILVRLEAGRDGRAVM